MPGIWNINNVYNSNVKKVSSKLTFELGEKFSARVLSKDDTKKSLVLRLLDGWQFPAEVEEPLDLPTEGVLRFQVEGYENGKLKIKLVKSNSEQEGLKEGSLESILNENGLDKKDLGFFEKMLNHEIPLTKENISKIKTLIDFRNKISASEEEEEQFINLYLQSKNIDKNSEKGKNIRETLKNYFHDLKNISEEDIFTLIENGLEVDHKNLESYKKIFKDSLGLYKEITKSLEDIKESSIKNSLEEIGSKEISNVVPERESLQRDSEGKVLRGTIEQQELKKLFQAIVKENLRTQVAAEEKLLNNLKNVLNKGDLKTIIEAIKSNLGKEIDVDRIIKELITGNLSSKNLDSLKTVVRIALEQFNDIREGIKDGVKGLFQDSIITEGEVNNITRIIEQQTEDNKLSSFKNNVIAFSNKMEYGASLNSEIDKLKNLLNGISQEKEEGILELLRPLSEESHIAKYLVEDFIGEKKFDFTREDINSIMRKLNNISDEDIAKSIKQELFNRLGIEDIGSDKLSREDVNNGIKTLLGKDLALSDKEAETLVKTLKFFGKEEILRSQAKAILPENTKMVKDIIQPRLMSLMENTSQTVVKEQLENKTLEIKNMIKDLINSSAKPEVLEKIINVFKGNINDFKLYNTISNQYYYLDLPLHLNNDQYPCKLIIKDERSKGKKIDSENVKLVVSINTLNLGTVDAYIKVKNNEMDIDIKSEERWIKPLELGKEKLINVLGYEQYHVFIRFHKREKEVDLASCREFFNDNDISALDIKV